MATRAALSLLMLSCESDVRFSVSERPTLRAARVFPTSAQPGEIFAGCIFASPIHYPSSDASLGRVIVADGNGHVAALDPSTGKAVWDLALPAPEGEQAFVVATPARSGDTLFVAFHTIAKGGVLNVNTTRLRHRVIAVNLRSGAIDSRFPTWEIAATKVLDAGQEISFDAAHALVRGALLHVPGTNKLGALYISAGNVRDIQPYRGWMFELDLDAWASGAAPLRSSLVTTQDADCGEPGGDGARDTRCGGGLWSPPGPTLLQRNGSYELLVSVGNGKLDLMTKSYSNTLLRTGPGLEISTGCDANRCKSFSSDNLDNACMQSCKNIYLPRLAEGEAFPTPDGGCEGLGLFDCWAKHDFLDAGGAPVVVALPSGRTVLVNPAKDGTLALLDANHLGTLYSRTRVVDFCGAPGDPCVNDWAGMIVAVPRLVVHNGQQLVLVPSFMFDKTHPAGVVAFRVHDDSPPRLERVWEMPRFASQEARTHFRQHTSQIAISNLDSSAAQRGEAPTAWVVEPRPGQGILWGIDAVSGEALVRENLAGPGYRFAAPLVTRDRVYITSCDSDSGKGHIEGFQLKR